LLTLRDFCGEGEQEVFAEHGFGHNDGAHRERMWLHRPVDGWDDLIRAPDGNGRETVILDATAGLDPRYLLPGQFGVKQAPGWPFPNTKIVLTGDATKGKLAKKRPQEVVEKLVADVAPYREYLRQGLLVITHKDLAREVEPLVAARVEAGELPSPTGV